MVTDVEYTTEYPITGTTTVLCDHAVAVSRAGLSMIDGVERSRFVSWSALPKPATDSRINAAALTTQGAPPRGEPR